MADIEEKRTALDQKLHSALTQWRSFANEAQEKAAALQEAQRINADLRLELRKLESKAGDVDRLKQQNQSLQQLLNEALAARSQHGSDDEHFSVPATQVQTNTPPATHEIAQYYPNLLKHNHEQAAKIEMLTGLLRAEKEKSKKWRLQFNIASSPAPTSPQLIPSSDSVGLQNPSRSGLVYPSTAFDPRPIDDGDCTRVPASPAAQEERKAKPAHIKIEVLQETSGNPRKRRKVSSGRQAAAISSVAEDGEEHNSLHTSTVVQPNKSSPAMASAHRRLGNLLAEPTVPKPRLLGPDSFLKPGRAIVDHGPPRKPRFLKLRSRKTLDAEDEGPCRARPLHRLSLNHFKINPDTNEGLDFAYQDVVRNHHARKCLSGCTDKCCVDKFRALAHTLYDTDNRGDETLDQQISNNSLLLDMLGLGSEEKIRTLTPAARANLIEEAKVRELSARYSRHRAAHPRATSPPGFWDAEMPGTQENSENREKADKVEREEVERRYRDAMKGDGRWMFVDE